MSVMTKYETGGRVQTEFEVLADVLIDDREARPG